MILTVDIGNSNVVIALFEKKEIKYNWRLKTRKKSKNSQKYEEEIQELFQKNSLTAKNVEGIVVSSVVPQITQIVIDALSFLKAKTLLIGDKNVKTNIVFKIDNPEQCGSDILMNIVASKNQLKENFIVIDMGTATTFDVAGKNGDFLGVIIAPGVRLSCQALSEGCAKLPACVVGIPKTVIGKNTRDSMNAGIYFGYIGLMREIVARIKKEYGHDMKVILTGGMSAKFAKNIDFVDYVDKDLTLKGLKLIWELNKNEKNI